MSTTQHPLTDEQIMGYHELPGSGEWFRDARYWFDAGREHERTATPANPHHDPRPWQDCTRAGIREGDLVERPCLGVVRVGVAHHQDEEGDWRARNGWVLTCGDRWPLRRIPAHTAEKGTTMTETPTPAEPLARTLLAVPDGCGAPHHDASRINPGDYVAQVDSDGCIRVGRAHHQDQDGDWEDERGLLITNAAGRADSPDALTVWPAPTPPAEEVQLPAMHPAHLPDVKGVDGAVCDHMALDRFGRWRGVDQVGVPRDWTPHFITAFTLPDGTRARRYGLRPDGEPRFVKTKEEA